MTRTAPRLIVLLSLLSAIGCDKRAKPQHHAFPTPSASVNSAASAKPDLAAKYPDAQVPVVADFEQEAESALNASNYKTELEAIDKEIGHVPDGTTPTDTAD